MTRMMMQAGAAAWLVMWVVVMNSVVVAETGQGTRTVAGEVLKISGTFAVVKGPAGKGVLEVASDTVLLQDENGQQVALHVSKDTKQDGVIDAGDKVEASVKPDGQIISIRSAKASDTLQR